MENFGILVMLVVGSLLAGFGLITALVAVAEDKTIAWIALIISIVFLAFSYHIFSVCTPINWVIFMAWPWALGVTGGKLIVWYSDDDDPQVNPAN
ncbi:MAG: hypothetical protein OEX81_00415 [Candidatus Pacebacteria bacterium]|nr:hypothetical protein [Candidatus Paceibacterota bacterium]